MVLQLDRKSLAQTEKIPLRVLLEKIMYAF